MTITVEFGPTIATDDARLDERDSGIIAGAWLAWNRRTGPRVGDFVEMLDGTTRRFTYDWGENIQTTDPKFTPSFYLGVTGYVSYSGALDDGIPKLTLVNTGESRHGKFWTFHHNEQRASNGVYFTVPCRVFKQIEG